jgi:hypothetical protein
MKVKVTARKFEGDDACSWAIFRSDRAQPVITGLSRREVSYHKEQVEKMIVDAAKAPATTLTKERMELGAKYLAMSNMCTIDRFRRDIKDLRSLERAVRQAWEDAVTGSMECEEGGYDDRNEDKAIRGVQAEINMFLKDLRAGGDKAKHWLDELKKELPFLFEAEKTMVEPPRYNKHGERVAGPR